MRNTVYSYHPSRISFNICQSRFSDDISECDFQANRFARNQPELDTYDDPDLFIPTVTDFNLRSIVVVALF